MSKIRHWKQRWDPNADLVFNRYMTVMGVSVKPGDPVSPELKAKLGRHRLKIWWQAGSLSLAGWAPKREPAAPPAKPEKPQLEPGVYPARKEGQFLVVGPNGKKRQVKGKEAAEALLAELMKPVEPAPEKPSEDPKPAEPQA